MKRHFSIYVVTGLLALVLSCGSDDGGGPSGPGNGGSTSNEVAVGFGALADAYAAVIQANAATYASVGTFGPFVIQSFLSPPPRARLSTPQPVAGQSSCLAVSMQDVVFAFDTNQSQYVPTMASGAPSGGARYILYEVDGSGAPIVPLVEAGFLDVDCDALADTVTTSVTNSAGVSVLGLQLNVLFVNAPDYIITTSPGTLRSPNGEFTLGVLFTADAEDPFYAMRTRLTVTSGLELFDSRVEGFQAGAGLQDLELIDGLPAPPYTAFGVGGNQSDESHNLEWNAATTTNVAADGTLRNIVQGLRAPLEYEDRRTTPGTNGVLACFSGNYRMPVVEDAASDFGCATGVIETPITLTANDLAEIRAGSIAMTDMLEAFSNMLALALPLIL